MFAAVGVVLAAVPYFQGKDFHLGNVLEMGLLAGTLFGIFVAVFLTPREITWDEETIRIRALLPGSRFHLAAT